jgi:hypothetical protein
LGLGKIKPERSTLFTQTFLEPKPIYLGTFGTYGTILEIIYLAGYNQSTNRDKYCLIDLDRL